MDGDGTAMGSTGNEFAHGPSVARERRPGGVNRRRTSWAGFFAEGGGNRPGAVIRCHSRDTPGRMWPEPVDGTGWVDRTPVAGSVRGSRLMRCASEGVPLGSSALVVAALVRAEFSAQVANFGEELVELVAGHCLLPFGCVGDALDEP